MTLYGTIVVIKDNGTDGSKCPVTKESFVMGRDESCDLRLCRTGVSGEHCRLNINKSGQARIADVSKNNQTLLNGKSVKKPVYLRNKDIITMSGKQFRWESNPAVTENKNVILNNAVGKPPGIVTPIRRVSVTDEVHTPNDNSKRRRSKAARCSAVHIPDDALMNPTVVMKNLQFKKTSLPGDKNQSTNETSAVPVKAKRIRKRGKSHNRSKRKKQIVDDDNEEEHIEKIIAPSSPDMKKSAALRTIHASRIVKKNKRDRVNIWKKKKIKQALISLKRSSSSNEELFTFKKDFKSQLPIAAMNSPFNLTEMFVSPLTTPATEGFSYTLERMVASGVGVKSSPNLSGKRKSVRSPDSQRLSRSNSKSIEHKAGATPKITSLAKSSRMSLRSSPVVGKVTPTKASLTPQKTPPRSAAVLHAGKGSSASLPNGTSRSRKRRSSVLESKSVSPKRIRGASLLDVSKASPSLPASPRKLSVKSPNKSPKPNIRERSLSMKSLRSSGRVSLEATKAITPNASPRKSTLNSPNVSFSLNNSSVLIPDDLNRTMKSTRSSGKVSLEKESLITEAASPRTNSRRSGSRSATATPLGKSPAVTPRRSTPVANASRESPAKKVQLSPKSSAKKMQFTPKSSAKKIQFTPKSSAKKIQFTPKSSAKKIQFTPKSSAKKIQFSPKSSAKKARRSALDMLSIDMLTSPLLTLRKSASESFRMSPRTLKGSPKSVASPVKSPLSTTYAGTPNSTTSPLKSLGSSGKVSLEVATPRKSIRTSSTPLANVLGKSPAATPSKSTPTARGSSEKKAQRLSMSSAKKVQKLSASLVKKAQRLSASLGEKAKRTSGSIIKEQRSSRSLKLELNTPESQSPLSLSRRSQLKSPVVSPRRALNLQLEESPGSNSPFKSSAKKLTGTPQSVSRKSVEELLRKSLRSTSLSPKSSPSLLLNSSDAGISSPRKRSASSMENGGGLISPTKETRMSSPSKSTAIGTESFYAKETNKKDGMRSLLDILPIDKRSVKNPMKAKASKTKKIKKLRVKQVYWSPDYAGLSSLFTTPVMSRGKGTRAKAQTSDSAAVSTVSPRRLRNRVATPYVNTPAASARGKRVLKNPTNASIEETPRRKQEELKFDEVAPVETPLKDARKKRKPAASTKDDIEPNTSPAQETLVLSKRSTRVRKVAENPTSPLVEIPVKRRGKPLAKVEENTEGTEEKLSKKGTKKKAQKTQKDQVIVVENKSLKSKPPNPETKGVRSSARLRKK